MYGVLVQEKSPVKTIRLDLRDTYLRYRVDPAKMLNFSARGRISSVPKVV